MWFRMAHVPALAFFSSYACSMQRFACGLVEGLQRTELIQKFTHPNIIDHQSKAYTWMIFTTWLAVLQTVFNQSAVFCMLWSIYTVHIQLGYVILRVCIEVQSSLLLNLNTLWLALYSTKQWLCIVLYSPVIWHCYYLLHMHNYILVCSTLSYSKSTELTTLGWQAVFLCDVYAPHSMAMA